MLATLQQTSLSLTASDQVCGSEIGAGKAFKVARPATKRLDKATRQYDLFSWLAHTQAVFRSADVLIFDVDFSRQRQPSTLAVEGAFAESPFAHASLPGPTQLSDYVPKSKSRYLNRDLMAFVARYPKLHKVSFELWTLGKGRVGDLVQLTEEAILEQTSASASCVAELTALLKPCGLRLGMKVTNWKTRPPPSMGY